MHGTGLIDKIKIVKTHDEVGAAASDSNGTAVDTSGFEGVVFVALLGTPAADNGIKVQQDTVVGMGTAQDLAGTKVLSDATETTVAVDVFRPRERFLRSVVIRGTSSTVPAGFAILYGPKTIPFDNDGQTDVAAEQHASPAEGTA